MRKIKQREISVLVAICLLLSVWIPALASESTVLPFTDVSAEDWYYEAVAYCYANGLLRGMDDEQYGPELGMDRSMAVTILYRLAGEPELPEEITETGYVDVAPESWYATPVVWATAVGVVQGYGDGSFGSADPVTLEQMATLLWRMVGEPEPGVDFPAVQIPEGVSAWAADAVSLCLALGVLDEETDAAEYGGQLPRSDVAGLVYVFSQLFFSQPEIEREWLNIEVPGAVTEDMEFLAQDHYAAYVNGDWARTAEIAPGKQAAGAGVDAQDIVDANMQAILTDETLTGHDAELVQNLYALILDWDARNELGMAPLEDAIADILAIESFADYTDYLIENESASTLFSANVTPGLADSSKYVVAIGPASLLLQDAAEYTERTAQGDLFYGAYSALTTNMLTRVGYTEEEALALLDRRLALEGKIAEGMLTLAETNAPDYVQRINNSRTFAELQETSPVFPLTQMLEEMGMEGSDVYLLTEPVWLETINQVYNADNLEELIAYQIVDAALYYSDSLDEASYRRTLEIQNEISGVEGTLPDEYMAYQTVASTLSTPMNRLYTERYCTPEMKADITLLIEETIAAYREMLREEDWLSEATRNRAIEKLDNLTVYAVYPEEWLDTSTLEIKSKADGGTLLDAYDAIGDYNYDYMLSLINQPVTEFWTNNTIVNAMYSPQENAIYICAGILNADYYRPDMSHAEMLGAIGMVIGHELSHAFDTVGAQFDKDGNMADWWIEEDYAAFQDRAQKVIDFYNKTGVFDGVAANGELEQGEAIADLGGLKCMLRIASREADFDYDAFFTAYARMWRMIATPEILQLSLYYDSHPPQFLRINIGVMQFDEFQQTYDVQESDEMYLAPEARIGVW